MSQLNLVLQEFCSRYHVIKSAVLIGFSGGADSVALLAGLQALSMEYGIDIIACHINHHLRGTESDGDQLFVEEFCSSLNVKLEIAHWLPLENMAQAIEERAREFRYTKFQEIAEKYQATWVLTAHHADDQVETILQRIMRGTSMAGLAGIPEIRELTPDIKIARPLLQVKRRDILDYLNCRGMTFREDSSNSDLTYTRNYLRQFLLPEVRKHLNSQCDEALLRLGEQARETHQYIESIAQQEFTKALLDDGEPLRLNRTILSNLPDLILREVLVHIWKHKGYELQGMTHQHWVKMAGQLKNSQATSQHYPNKIQVTTRDKLILIGKLH